MLIKFCIGLIVLLFCYGAYNRQFANSQSASPGPPNTVRSIQPDAITGGAQSATVAAIPAFNACSLISSSEIESVQRTAVQQTQPTGYAFGDLELSQCYYTAISGNGENLSVHLQLIQRNPKSTSRDALNEFWNERFKQARGERESKEKREEEREKAEEEEDFPEAPISVHGIGNEAYWLASKRGGALYVLNSDKVLRVSAGGANDTKTQIRKSKTLAEKALRHLQ